ncbi:hypothetical protein LNV09_20250 [Paucibacter sp. B2R-40]|nr:hypothetical protein [Paucibacter sp. B2R-40]
MNALGQGPAGERPQRGRGNGMGAGGMAEFHVDGLGAIGFESACPALLASFWPDALPEGGESVELS